MPPAEVTNGTVAPRTGALGPIVSGGLRSSDLVPCLGLGGRRAATSVQLLNQIPELGLHHRILVPAHS